MNNFEETAASFWDHASELRKVFIKSLFLVLFGMFICFWFHQKIVNFLAQPLNVNLPPDPTSLVILGPLDGMLSILKLSFWMGLVLTAPGWLYFIFKFIQPALNPMEQTVSLPFFGLSLLFMLPGGALGYFVILPMANKYFFAFNSEIGINMWSLSYYLNFTLFLLLASALSFELGALFFILVHYNLISLENMVGKRRYVILAAFIAGAVLTPPDVITQFAFALPLIALYEIAILYARWRLWMRQFT